MSQPDSVISNEAGFYVEGGVWVNTEWKQIATDYEIHGPFQTYDEAYEQWAALSWKRVDTCVARYRIITFDAEHQNMVEVKRNK